MMKVYMAAGFSLLISLVLSSGLALAAVQGLPTKRISMETRSSGTKDALTSLLQHSDLKYEVDPSVTNDRKVTIEVKEAKWADVFRFLMKQGDLTYNFEGDGTLRVTQRSLQSGHRR